jgi:hypothetical protein
MMLLKQIFKKRDGRGMDWIDLAQDSDRWLDPANAAMKHRVLQSAGNFLTS